MVAGAQLFAFFPPVVMLLADRFRGKSSPSSKSKKTGKNSSDERVLALERQLERLRSLLRTTATLNASLNYERVLEMALDLATSAVDELDTSNGTLIGALMLFADNRLYVASARGLTHADMRVELPCERGVLAEAVTTGETKLCGAPTADPELQRMVAFHNCREVLCIPLIVGLEIFGIILYAHPQNGYFSEYRVDILEAVALQAMVALQNAKLYDELAQEKERMMETQEEARKKLARDLHDGPTQSIGAIAMRVNFARRLVTRDVDAASEELYKIEELARRTTKEIRQMLFTLRPLVLESEGLVPALEQLAEKLMENHGQQLYIEASPEDVADLEVGKQGVVFFIVEEAVNNARKHARADHIWVRMRRKADLLQLEVEDNGVGFDLSAVESSYEQRESLGMVNLRERSELVNGVLQIDSARGRGTKISVTIPMTVEAAERLHRPGFSG
jgi:signal transduction histidine kinase